MNGDRRGLAESPAEGLLGCRPNAPAALSRAAAPGRVIGRRIAAGLGLGVLFVAAALGFRSGPANPAAIAQMSTQQTDQAQSDPSQTEQSPAEGAPSNDPSPNDSRSTNEKASPTEHGRYLATDVAMCVMCHSPRDRGGNLIEGRLFRGAPMPVRSPYRGQDWAFTAPSIAGLPGGWSEEDLVRLLTTGRRPDGTQPLPPMPPFRMNESDAKAVAAFLRQLR